MRYRRLSGDSYVRLDVRWFTNGWWYIQIGRYVLRAF